MMRCKNKRAELPSRHPEKPKATKDLLPCKGERPRSKPLRPATEEILRFAQNDEGFAQNDDDAPRGHRPRGLLASLLAVALALGLLAGTGAVAAAAGAGEAAETSTGGSTVGILIDNTPSKEDVESGKFTGNDSYLGVLVTPEQPESVTATFMLAEGRVYATVPVPYGSLLNRPNDPVWPAGAQPPAGVEGTPVFDRWCTDAAGTTAYDFASPVLAPLTLWAGWASGEPVDVTLDAGEGGVVADPSDPAAEPQRTVVVQRYPGAFYRELPVPEKTGYTFAHWATEEGAAVDPASDKVPAEGIRLEAAWTPNRYWVHYAFNDGTGGYRDVGATYDDATAKILTWDEAAGGASEPYGKDFDGWNTRADGTGTWYAGGAVLPNLTAAPGGSVSLYAQWKDEFTVDDGPFEVRFMTNNGTGAGGAGTVWREFVGDERINKGDRVAAFDPPKRTGYQFSEWWVGRAGDAGDPQAPPVLERAWSFDEQVMGNLTLYATWTLRMDVTVPVSVGFAVDAESREVVTPDAGRYAIKSRTVRDVQVNEMAVVSPDDELAGFFRLPEGEAGEAAWQEALNKTELWIWRAGGASAAPDTAQRPSGAGSLALPLANADGEKGTYVKRGTDGSETAISGWRNAQSLKNDASFRLDAFDYAGVVFDESWQGADPSVEVPLKFGMKISDTLEVRTDLDGPTPITHLIVTVSAKG